VITLVEFQPRQRRHIVDPALSLLAPRFQPLLLVNLRLLTEVYRRAIFQIEGGAGLGLTYVTGALVKVGQLMAAALTGGRRWDWVPNLLLWAALVAGSACGALAYHWINLAAVWFAAGVALALSVIVAVAARL